MISSVCPTFPSPFQDGKKRQRRWHSPGKVFKNTNPRQIRMRRCTILRLVFLLFPFLTGECYHETQRQRDWERETEREFGGRSSQDMKASISEFFPWQWALEANGAVEQNQSRFQWYFFKFGKKKKKKLVSAWQLHMHRSKGLNVSVSIPTAKWWNGYYTLKWRQP